jgi:hypothetical protein
MTRSSGDEPEGKDRPAAARGPVDFDSQIRPILQARCLNCHARGKIKGGFSLETREALLRGGEGGPAVEVGHSDESLLIELVTEADPVLRMPQKGDPLTSREVALLRAWIDQGMAWPEGFSFGFRRAPLAPRTPEVPPAPRGLTLENPVDRFVARDAGSREAGSDWARVSDRLFARRAYLDLTGLLPEPAQLEAFDRDDRPDRDARLVAALLKDRKAYADHWLSFWNDALRNAYRGTGFIDGGRTSITAWLYRSLYENKPYDQFVHELISPVAGSQGFTKGIVWRGVVNASQAPPVQAAQNLAQVFLGTNLKCASCHDSFVNNWKLTDAYALASVFAEKPLELHRCDKPTGRTSTTGFIYPELGTVDASAPRAERLSQLADLVVKPEDGRLARTIVNRLWAHLMGRGIVEPLDDMDQPPWSQDLLDWLAADLVAHGYDLKHTLTQIATSRAYRLPSVGQPDPADRSAYVFRGPLTRRMSAEQFADALSAVTGIWPKVSGEMLKVDGRGQGGQVAAVRAAVAAAEKAGREDQPAAPKISARYVWNHDDAENDRGGRILLRKVIKLDAVPKRVVVVASCDNELVLHVNGHKVAQSEDWTSPVVREISAQLQPGDNVIAAEATNWPDAKHGRGLQHSAPNPAAFIAWVGGFDEHDRQVWGHGTDASWLWAADASGADWMKPGFKTAGWAHAVELPAAGRLYGARLDLSASAMELLGPEQAGTVRAALSFDDPLLAALGRTSREQVVTRRDSIATTLQALELTNGATLANRLRPGALRWVEQHGRDPGTLVERLFLTALGREPTPRERAAALALIGTPARSEAVEDLLWSILLLPEFQLIE